MKQLEYNLKKTLIELNIDIDDTIIKDMITIIKKFKKDNKIINKNELISIIKSNSHNNNLYENIDFNDEIVSIIELDEYDELIDIEVENEDSLFYANDILTHNSAYGNIDADMSSISDSIGIAQTADLLVALVQNASMAEENKVMLKFLKNRLEGFLGSILLEVDYHHMTYRDWIDNDNENNNNNQNNDNNSNQSLNLGEFSFD